MHCHKQNEVYNVPAGRGEARVNMELQTRKQQKDDCDGNSSTKQMENITGSRSSNNSSTKQVLVSSLKNPLNDDHTISKNQKQTDDFDVGKSHEIGCNDNNDLDGKNHVLGGFNSDAHAERRQSCCCTCCLILGLRGTVGLLLMGLVAGLLIIANLQFRSPLFVVSFVALASAFCILYCVYLATTAAKKIKNPNTKNKPTNSRKRKRTIFCFKQIACVLSVYRNVADTDGKYYIIKEYVSETIEYVFQLVAIFATSCNLPIEVTALFFSVLALESFFIGLDTLRIIRHGITVKRRNNRVMVDVVIEVFCSAAPLLILRFVYRSTKTKTVKKQKKAKKTC